MAKTFAPLMSFGASGKIANALVYFPWKGINAVREYVIPANPRTADQITQRTYFSDAVDEFHDANYTAADVIAWNRYAGILEKIMSGFNAMIKKHVTEGILGNTWERIHNGSSANPHDTDFEVDVEKVAGGNAPTCYYGTRKTHFPDSEVLDNVGGGHWGKTLTGLTADTLYYFYFDVGTSGTDFGRTGIYQQRTAAA